MGCSGSKDTAVDTKPTITAGTTEPAQPKPGPTSPDDVKLEPAASGGGAAAKPSKDNKRRVGVSAEATKAEAATKKAEKVEKSEEARATIAAATKESALFAGLTEEQRTEIIDVMFPVPCEPGKVVIAQGDVGDNFYIVDTGEYEVYLKQAGDKAVHTYKAGNAFGELALMYNSPRAATVKCSSAGSLWGLDQGTFRQVLMGTNKAAIDDTAQFLKSVDILSPLTDEQREKVGAILEKVTHTKGQLAVTQGDPAASLYVVKAGSLSASVQGVDEHKELVVGSYFGENALSKAANPTFTATVEVTSAEAELYQLDRTKFVALLGDLTKAMQANLGLTVLSEMEFFQALGPSERQLLMDSMKESKFAKGEDIITEGEEVKETANFYIISSGSVKVTANGDLVKASLTSGNYFGEIALLEDKPRMATVTATSDTVCMTIDRVAFTKILGPMNDLMTREADKRQTEAEAAQKASIKLSELKMMSILGVGTFGRVKLVLHEATNTPYALKCMRKGQIIALKQVEHVMNEKNILAMCTHPFLLTMAASYQDADELYMLLELALGGELFSILRDKVKFDEPTSRFYTANVCAAFEYLHDRKIVYRDLKPENLLLDSDGYLKVVDFGFAKILEDRTWTLCGTPEYLAPEIISNRGHNLAVDWWALGILVFELLHGQPPFAADEPMEIYQKIMKGKVLFPNSISKNAKDLITKLLVANPSGRLGSLKRGEREVREQPFFKAINFVELEKKIIKAPIVPTISNPLDTSNFEEYEDESGEDWLRFNTPGNTYFTAF